MLRGPVVTPLHEGADRGGCGVEDRHAIALAQLPEPVLLRPVGRPFVHEACRTAGQWAVHQVRVARDPADVGRAPEDVVLLEVEDHLGGRCRTDQVATGGVHDALGLARGPGGVEDEEGILRVHRLGLAPHGRVPHHAVPPLVPALGHLGAGLATHGAGAALHHDDVLDGRRLLARRVHIALERHDAAPAIPAVRRDEDLALRVVDAVAHRLRREPAEDHRVDGADPGARQHADGRLGDERQVDRHTVALHDAERLEHVGELVDGDVEVPVGQRAPVTGLSLEDQRRLVPAPGPDVAVHAVHGRVDPAAHEPLGTRGLPIQHLRPRRAPFELLRLAGPVRGGILRGRGVDAGCRDVGLGTERRVGLELPVLLEEHVDVGHVLTLGERR